MRIYAKPKYEMQLCLLRCQKQLSVAEASKLCNVSRSIIWKIENGDIIGINTAHKITDAYKIKLQDYFILVKEKE